MTTEELAYIKSQVQALVEEYQAQGGIPTAGAQNEGNLSVSELTARQKNVSSLFDKLQQEALTLGRKDLELRELKEEDSSIKQRLDEASNRIDQLNLESSSSDRISILSYGERPTTPPKSKRLPLTVAAGMGGMLAGFGVVALWGLVERKIRSVQHIQQLQPTLRVLGVLPVLPDELDDPEEKALAAHCVHQIRILLDSRTPGKSNVIAVTSPCSGDGKTSLTLALGLSFAAAGSRTLLIDCDMVGAGLTSRLKAVCRRGPGDILLREQLITESQLREAQQTAATSGRKLAEVLVDDGYASAPDAQRAVAVSAKSRIGLLNALDGEEISSCITPVLGKRLNILPLGGSTVVHSSQMSSTNFRRVITEARKLFDVVIVDTGPILGSIEAPIVVREVDEVVLAVARDGKVPQVNRAVLFLNSLGVRLSGLVFNRATSGDVSVAYYGSRTRSSSTSSGRFDSSRDLKRPDASSQDPPRLGSLEAAVVGSMDDRPEEE